MELERGRRARRTRVNVEGVNHTELTDEPCPKCGASLDIKVVMPKNDTALDQGSPQQRETVRLNRVKLCPDCGWSEIL